MSFKNESASLSLSDTNYPLSETAVNTIDPGREKLLRTRQIRSPQIINQSDEERWQKAQDDETKTLNQTID